MKKAQKQELKRYDNTLLYDKLVDNKEFYRLLRDNAQKIEWIQNLIFFELQKFFLEEKNFNTKVRFPLRDLKSRIKKYKFKSECDRFGENITDEDILIAIHRLDYYGKISTFALGRRDRLYFYLYPNGWHTMFEGNFSNLIAKSDSELWKDKIYNAYSLEYMCKANPDTHKLDFTDYKYFISLILFLKYNKINIVSYSQIRILEPKLYNPFLIFGYLKRLGILIEMPNDTMAIDRNKLNTYCEKTFKLRD